MLPTYPERYGLWNLVKRSDSAPLPASNYPASALSLPFSRKTGGGCTATTTMNTSNLPGKVKTPRAASTILARRAASARYREKHKEEVRAKARERMARRRAETTDDQESKEQARRQAQERSRLYRERHACEIAERKREARARAFIERYGADTWVAREAQRHIRSAAIAEDETLWAWDETWAQEQENKRLRQEAAQSLLRVSRS
ncbi:hypothetical protein C8F01DRAFT_1092595 [Mycena amicta]|nr:hypothetical protein C8F01DRAFT_1092595 [Mycena amicta]